MLSPMKLPFLASTYRTAGIPKDVVLRRFSRAKLQSLPFTELVSSRRNCGKLMHPYLHELNNPRECLVLLGEVS